MKTSVSILVYLFAVASIVYTHPTKQEDDMSKSFLLEQNMMQNALAQQGEEEENQQSVKEFQEAILQDTDVEEPSQGAEGTAKDIMAVLEGKELAVLKSSEEAMSQNMLTAFNAGLNSFISRMSSMATRYYNYYNCLPNSEAELQQEPDKNDEELVKRVVDELASSQGSRSTAEIRSLFSRIRRFLSNTRNKGTTLYRDIQSTLARVFRRYQKVITCLRRFQG